MTTRLYYTDADLLSFQATVRACEPHGDRFHVRLDRSAFYPSSGGQPFDTGRLNDIAVVERDGDEDVVHVTDAAIGVGSPVAGEIDAARRLDHRQQHTGQHLLSAVFDTRLSAPTSRRSTWPASSTRAGSRSRRTR